MSEEISKAAKRTTYGMCGPWTPEKLLEILSIILKEKNVLRLELDAEGLTWETVEVKKY